MDQHWGKNIETLSEQLKSLRITEEEALEEIIKIESIDKISTVLAIHNEQAVIFKSMVLDPEWFNGNRTKFEDW